MREITIVVMLFVFSISISLNAQTKKSNSDNQIESIEKPEYANLMMVEYSLINCANKGITEFITKDLMSSSDVFFCCADFENKKLYVLRTEAEEITKTYRNAELKILKSDSFDENEFLQLYSLAGLNKNESNDNELPSFVNTGNRFKDNCNYAKAKEIFVKQNAEYYNSIK